MRWTLADLRVMKLRHGEASDVCCLPGSADGHQRIANFQACRLWRAGLARLGHVQTLARADLGVRV